MKNFNPNKTDNFAIKRSKKFVVVLLGAILSLTVNLIAGELYIGTAATDITPELPVALQGQFHLRIAQTAETPLTANVVVLESRDGNRSRDVAVMVSCDVALITENLVNLVRDEVKKQLPELDVKKIILSATHTHTAPVYEMSPSFLYNVPREGVVQVEDYRDFFVQQVAEAIIEAWNNRRPGGVTWGLSHAAIAYNRRIVYSKEFKTPGRFADGTARMYGNTNVPEFINIEGMEDHDINILFFWDNEDKLMATIINIACPAQEVEGRSAVNADYWHPVREKLKQRFGRDLTVLGWIGAAGDQSPRPMYRKAAEERMVKLRNLNRLEEIARRIVIAVEDTYETVKKDRYEDVELIHQVETIPLPMRMVKEDEYEFAKAERDKYAAQITEDPKSADQLLGRMTWNADVAKRFEMQKENPNPKYDTQVHVLRIGDIVICTNPFELFTDYGIRIQARSKALQTISLQLTNGCGGYLPTEKAVEGGGYSAIVQSGLVGPEGGQILVDRSVKMINDMF